jgi:hypothetical protein
VRKALERGIEQGIEDVGHAPIIDPRGADTPQNANFFTPRRVSKPG